MVNNIRLEKKIDIYVKNKNNMQSNNLIYVLTYMLKTKITCNLIV